MRANQPARVTVARTKHVFVDRQTTLFPTRQNLPNPVPGGTSTFREFSKRRNERGIYLLPPLPNNFQGSSQPSAIRTREAQAPTRFGICYLGLQAFLWSRLGVCTAETPEDAE